ncbi:uncharacterized protein BP01DRAFT_385431 [Aspergillus saccharolyticus JOP 1030-1]|uniref:Uncharacterized protein n=1 Tax=Aspergillus saccharolyticus JOP 1030-1 TaxID=1450539 RepID=A0A318ZR26_9EURO|nr:hypothetical protein BP01DRAFT_385431 [Aspergillus saccharolyticus JOP 1030-1]PYH42548.1 hypothetical protein BP01DRAFT_385431 [Aspergillus saccharolyticus JOP 1030-1]
MGSATSTKAAGLYIPLHDQPREVSIPRRRWLDKTVTIRGALQFFLMVQVLLWITEQLIVSYWYPGYAWYKESEIGCYYQEQGLTLISSLLAGLGLYLWMTCPRSPRFTVCEACKTFVCASCFIWAFIKAALWVDELL